MRVRLVVDKRSVPWPKAEGVHVSRTVSDAQSPGDAEVRLALAEVPHDWTHVLKTVW